MDNEQSYDIHALLNRIANALERQCDQHQAWTEQQQQWRDDNVTRHQRNRDDELAALRATNSALLEKLDAVLLMHERNLDAMGKA